MTDDDLDLVETDVLFAALERRFKYVVLLAEKNYGEDSEMAGWYAGGFTAAWGLIARAPAFFDRIRSARNKGPHPE